MKLPVAEFRSAFEVINHVGAHAGLLPSTIVKMVCAKGILKLGMTGLCCGEATLAVPDPSANWTFYLDRRVLEAFLSSTRAHSIDLNIVKDSLVLLAGKQKTVATPMGALAGYASWKPVSNGTLKITDQLRKELGVLAAYAPITLAADHLSAVYLIKDYGIMATDSKALAVCLDATVASTFPLPVIISELAASKKIPQLELDKHGAGIKFPEGYIYQTVSARCKTDYPVAMVQGLVESSRKLKPVLKIKAGKLNAALEYLKVFIFGADTDVNIFCTAGQKPKSVMLTTDLINGRTQMASVGEEVAADLKLKWPISRISPWVSYIAGMDPEQEIHCACDPTTEANVMTAPVGKRSYILIVVKMV